MAASRESAVLGRGLAVLVGRLMVRAVCCRLAATVVIADALLVVPAVRNLNLLLLVLGRRPCNDEAMVPTWAFMGIVLLVH